VSEPIPPASNGSALRVSLVDQAGSAGSSLVVTPADDAAGATVEGHGSARLVSMAGGRSVIETTDGATTTRSLVLVGPAVRSGVRGRLTREVVVDGWRFEVAIESERLASLRERASRGDAASTTSSPLDVRAIIPGRIVALSVVPGDAVTTGEQLMVLEAMKMQNELRAPREGTVGRVQVAVGDRVEVGDVLLVFE